MEELLDNFDKFCFDKNLFEIRDKVLDNNRIDINDALNIMATNDINSLGQLAAYKKNQLHGRKVYFVVNRHINPTNVCAISCKFCECFS